jgi:hypothetical protein
MEGRVSAFRRSPEEKRTPFVEIAPEVVAYVSNVADKCVKKVFEQLVISDGQLTALSPFNRLTVETGPSPIAPVYEKYDPQKDYENIGVMRGVVENIKSKVMKFAGEPGSRSFEKTAHYLRLLEQRLSILNRQEHIMRMMQQPYGIKATKDMLPGLFLEDDNEEAK